MSTNSRCRAANIKRRSARISQIKRKYRPWHANHSDFSNSRGWPPASVGIEKNVMANSNGRSGHL